MLRRWDLAMEEPLRKVKAHARKNVLSARAEDSCAAKGGDGVVEPLTVRKGKDKKGKRGYGPKRSKV